MRRHFPILTVSTCLAVLAVVFLACGFPTSAPTTSLPDVSETTPPPATPLPDVSETTPHSVPDGFEFAEEPSLGLTLVRPVGWDRDTGVRTLPESGGTVRYVVYYTAAPGQVRLINLATADVPLPRADEEDFIESALGEDVASLEDRGFRVLETLSDIVVGGHPASGIAYRITDPRGLDLFSILITVSGPDGNGYMMQWASNETNEAEMRDIFQNMIGTIQFVQ